jgi:tetratricopeptide (TPR) repeat protein
MSKPHEGRRALLLPALGLLLIGTQVAADALSELPPPWQDRLLPVAETDLGGAERLMQEAVPEARAEVAGLLAQEAPDPEALAAAYGRLGALLLLLEVEAQADACFRNASTLQPQELRWPYYAGYLAMMTGNTDRALEQLEAAAAIDPGYPTLQLRLGRVRLDRSELPEAKAALKRVADVPGLVAAANYYLGQIAVMERDYQTAAALLEKALEADADAHQAHYPLAQAYRALGKEELAREHLGRFRQQEPAAADPLLDELRGAVKRSLPAFQKGIHAIREGDYAGAAEHFEAGLAVDAENARARVSHARALYLSGRREEAAAQLDEALSLDSELVLASFLRGVLAQERGEPEAAAEWYGRALALEPGHAGALFYLANLQFSAGDHAGAARGYRAALGADTEIPPARLLELVARYRAGEPESGLIQALEQIAADHPEDPLPLYALTRLLASATDPALRRPARALELANRLALAQPIPPHQRLQALALAAAGDYEQAAGLQRRIIAGAAWTAPQAEREALERELAAYEGDRLPDEPWLPGDPLLSPPPFDPVAPFRDYPAAIPY